MRPPKLNGVQKSEHHWQIHSTYHESRSISFFWFRPNRVSFWPWSKLEKGRTAPNPFQLWSCTSGSSSTRCARPPRTAIQTVPSRPLQSYANKTCTLVLRVSDKIFDKRVVNTKHFYSLFHRSIKKNCSAFFYHPSPSTCHEKTTNLAEGSFFRTARHRTTALKLANPLCPQTNWFVFKSKNVKPNCSCLTLCQNA